MRKKVLVPIADGVEDIETIAIIDILRRAAAEVTVAAISDLQIITANRVKIIADVALEAVKDNDFDLIVLPGGMPGAEYLRDSQVLVSMLKRQQQENKFYAAICAAPVVILHHHNLIGTLPATCHPSMSQQLPNFKNERVVVANKCITSQGPGTSLEFALKLVELLFDQQRVDQLKQAMVY